MADAGASVWDGVPGQARAVERLRGLAGSAVQSYLLVGPEGCGKERAARAFATVLVAGSDDAGGRVAGLVARGEYPDVHEVWREGAAVDAEEAEAIVRASATTPLESARKVIVVHEVHLMKDSAAVRLLKTIEEPSPGVAFVLLADQVTPAMATIRSRCATVAFARLDDDVVVAELEREGHPREAAGRAARAAMGNLERARLLAADRGLAERLEAFARVPQRLDGTGRAVAEVAAELDALLDRAVEPVQARQARELEELEARVAMTGERGAGRRSLEARHKREVRKQRTDELRAGLARLAAAYHEALVARPDAPEAGDWSAAIAAIHRAMGHLGLNAREDLLLEALLLRCPSLVPARA